MVNRPKDTPTPAFPSLPLAPCLMTRFTSRPACGTLVHDAGAATAVVDRGWRGRGDEFEGLVDRGARAVQFELDGVHVAGRGVGVDLGDRVVVGHVHLGRRVVASEVDRVADRVGVEDDDVVVGRQDDVGRQDLSDQFLVAGIGIEHGGRAGHDVEHLDDIDQWRRLDLGRVRQAERHGGRGRRAEEGLAPMAKPPRGRSTGGPVGDQSSAVVRPAHIYSPRQGRTQFAADKLSPSKTSVFS